MLGPLLRPVVVPEVPHLVAGIENCGNAKDINFIVCIHRDETLTHCDAINFAVVRPRIIFVHGKI